jgi:hypothetical protein
MGFPASWIWPSLSLGRVFGINGRGGDGEHTRVFLRRVAAARGKSTTEQDIKGAALG